MVILPLIVSYAIIGVIAITDSLIKVIRCKRIKAIDILCFILFPVHAIFGFIIWFIVFFCVYISEKFDKTLFRW